MIIDKQFPVLDTDTLGTGVYHSYIIAEQREYDTFGGGFRVFILGEGRSCLFTIRKHSMQAALTYAREEVNRRDNSRVKRNLSRMRKMPA